MTARRALWSPLLVKSVPGSTSCFDPPQPFKLHVLQLPGSFDLHVAPTLPKCYATIRLAMGPSQDSQCNDTAIYSLRSDSGWLKDIKHAKHQCDCH